MKVTFKFKPKVREPLVTDSAAKLTWSVRELAKAVLTHISTWRLVFWVAIALWAFAFVAHAMDEGGGGDEDRGPRRWGDDDPRDDGGDDLVPIIFWYWVGIQIIIRLGRGIGF